MQTLSADQLVGQTVGNYRVERLLGQGRLNAVYLARNLSSQRTDALTLYLVPERFSSEAHRRFLSRFLKGAAAVSALQHPHILPIHEYGEATGYPYLITPYMMNGSLAGLLKEQGRLSHTEVLNVLEQIAGGLEYAHKQRHIHGTLKPSNIVFNKDKSILVAGFGLMYMLQIRGIERNDSPYAHLLSIADTFMAAPEYIAPEVVQGQSIDKRSDIYALGAILYELLSGRPPFSGKNPLEVAKQHVKQQIPPLRELCPDVPVALVSVVNQALERDPDRRFQHISELAEAFAQVSNGATGRLQQVSGSKEKTENTGSWQLMPPIVTGKMEALTPNKSVKDDPDTDSLPLKSSAAPTEKERSTDGMKPFDWWSMPGEVLDVAPKKAPEPEPASLRQQDAMSTQGPLRLSNPDMAMGGWNGPEPIRPLPNPSKRARPKDKQRRGTSGVSRRQVVALLAGGGILAAGAVIAINLNHFAGTNAANQQGNMALRPGAIASTNMPVNTGVDFKNTKDNKDGVLVHLTTGQFVAFDRACTHDGVNVNYDPGTKKLVCPAHGAIFDPANNGKVVQLPTDNTPIGPLPKMNVQVNQDGSITV